MFINVFEAGAQEPQGVRPCIIFGGTRFYPVFLRDKNLRRGLLEFLPFQIGAAESRFAKPLTAISKAGGYLSMDGCLVNWNFLTEAIFALGTASSKHIVGRSVGRINKVVQPILILVYPHLP